VRLSPDSRIQRRNVFLPSQMVVATLWILCVLLPLVDSEDARLAHSDWLAPDPA